MLKTVRCQVNKEYILKQGWGRECGTERKTMKRISEDSVVIRKVVLWDKLERLCPSCRKGQEDESRMLPIWAAG